MLRGQILNPRNGENNIYDKYCQISVTYNYCTSKDQIITLQKRDGIQFRFIMKGIHLCFTDKIKVCQ